MRAVTIDDGRLVVADVADPVPRSDEVLVEVTAAGVNRADTVQRRGGYEPPAGASAIPGLECSGIVRAVGDRVQEWVPGDAVCALLAGGGYADLVAVPAGQVLPAPAALSLVHAAGLPEALSTVWSNLVDLGGLRSGETVLVHGGSSGIGTTAIQVAVSLGARVVTTVGNEAKADACRDLGAEPVIYRSEDFVDRVHDLTSGRGADVVLDLVGADYLARNVEALAVDGRLVIIGLQSGSLGELELRTVLRKRARITGSLLRSRPVAEKSRIVAAVRSQLLPLVEDGRIVPVIDSVLPLADARLAHERLEASAHVGKILLASG